MTGMTDPYYLTAGDCLPALLYIQFQMMLNQDGGNGYKFVIGDANTDVTSARSISFCGNNGNVSRLVSTAVDVGGELSMQLEGAVFSLSEWHTIQLGILTMSGRNLCSGNVDGVMMPIVVGSLSECYIPLQKFFFGVMAGAVSDIYFKDITMGTGGFGSSNLFRFNHAEHLLSQSVTPPFDSVVGTGMSIDSTGLRFQTSGADVYVTKSLPFPDLSAVSFHLP